MHPLFSGTPDSIIYAQLLHAYQLYRFVVAQRNQPQASSDFIVYADELFCYGLYKVGDDNLPKAYRQIHDAIQKSIA
ncbi:MAG: hypothetical protein RIQ94_2962, partial [Pseudomonadota bacterium]